jgi:NADPH:quinone reductase-like Zn-dependent oxidoreductase/acyl carrier protein
VSLPDSDRPAGTGGFGVPPALLDAVLHPLVAQDQELRLPFSWTDVTLHATTATELRVRLTPAGDDVAITASDPSGGEVFQVKSFASRPANPVALRPTSESESLYELRWVPAAPAEPDPADGDPAEPPPATLLRRTAVTARDPAAVPAAVDASLRELLTTVQRWLREQQGTGAQLIVVTASAVAAGPGEHVTNLAGAAEWGLLRSAQTEHPGRIVLVDVDLEEPNLTVPPALLAAGESQLALRNGEWYAARLALAEVDDPLTPPGDNWLLAQREPGSLDGLGLLPADPLDEPPPAGQVRVAVRAAGLNFRDALIGLGMVPEGHLPVGCEAAGVVVAVGPDVSEFAPGDRVMGLFTGGISPMSDTDWRLLAPVPSGWSFAEAAALPVVFLTVYYALVDLAGTQPGESILVHAATGGVGLAAIQLARQLGAEVYATASPGKWQTLRDLGINEDRIASSRSLEFAERFAGSRIDVVLNSLAHEYVDASLGLLSPGGRFLELGKRDIRTVGAVEELAPGVRYQAFDLFDAGPDRIREILADLRRQCEDGRLAPLPVTAWDIRRAPEALRYLSQARHIGKVVLTVPTQLDPAGTVLITGGTGSLGGLLARHLAAQHGVRHLLLLGRRGADAASVAELTSDLAALGAEARVIGCDLADRNELAAAIATVPDEHPLTAVVHAAGTLADGAFEALTAAQLGAATRPKIDGGWHLHELTAGADLAAFVTYSSIAGTLGTGGQANYAAANAFLDGLTGYRHAQGLPAKSLAWGLWATPTGMTGHLDDADRARLAQTAGRPIATADGLALFDTATDRSRPALILANLASARAAAGAPAPALLRDLTAAPGLRANPETAGAQTQDPAAYRAALAAAADDRTRRRMLVDLVRDQAATVLGHPGPDRIGATHAFGDLGLDSLTAVELRNRLAAQTGLRLPTTLLFRYPTPAALADYLSAKLQG